MTTGERLSQISSVNNTEALNHLMNIFTSGYEYIPAITIGANMQIGNLITNIIVNTTSANIVNTIQLNANLIDDDMDTSIITSTINGELKCK